jgi:poly(3-hydroxybutyrate) depolymerase
MRRRVYGVIIIIILLSIAALYLSYYSNSKISAPENPVKIIADGQEREYFYNLPVTGKKKLPLVIILHGGGGPLGSAELMMEKSGWKELSDREGFLAVFPQATLEHPDKPLNLTDDFSDPSRNIRDWNDGSGGTAASRKGIADTEYIVKVIDDLALKFPLDRSLYDPPVGGGNIRQSLSYRTRCRGIVRKHRCS